MSSYTRKIKEEVKVLRRQGWSLNELNEKFHIPKTTLRGWIKEIKLTSKQKEKFRLKILQSLQQGRIQAQQKNKENRIMLEQTLKSKGIEQTQNLSKRELFVAGIALYWAEGFKNKHEHRLGFCNSDPVMMKFYIYWLEKCLGIKKEELVARVTLNKIYEYQAKDIEKFWAEYLGITLQQFTKPFYQKSIWKKQFNTDNYKGVLRIHVKDSLEHLLQMRGWIEGLKMIK